MKIKSCCRDFDQIFEDGTDNEYYGPLGLICDSEVTIGGIDRPINYCPWCGKEIELESTK